MPFIDHIEADRYSPLDVPVIFTAAGGDPLAGAPIQSVIIGTDAAGALPSIDPGHYDLLLTIRRDAPRPWVFIAPPRWDQALSYLEAAVRGSPIAATTLTRTLRLAEHLPVEDGLIIESYAYSMLLGGEEFRRWRSGNPAAVQVIPTGGPETVRWHRDGDDVTLTLDAPDTRNATTALMRDALYAALANCLDDPSRPRIILRAAGRCFSTGGHTDEFGTAIDLAMAHVSRTLHSCTRAIFALGDRIEVRLHGACIGSGVEIAAAAGCRSAAPGTWFQLPELRMGLIPGAGGTVSIAGAVGRHRTTWMVLTGARLAARRALDWGLVNSIHEAP